MNRYIVERSFPGGLRIPQTEQGAACPKVLVKSVGRLLGEAIKRIHHGDSISSLFV